VCVDLPSADGVIILRFDHRFVGVRVLGIRRRFSKQQQILGHSAAHLRSVLALLGPAKAIGLIVLANDVGHDRLHSHIAKAVLRIMLDAFRMKRINDLEAETGHSGWNNAVFDVDRGDTSGL
jgi:hypothetical protein